MKKKLSEYLVIVDYPIGEPFTILHHYVSSLNIDEFEEHLYGLISSNNFEADADSIVRVYKVSCSRKLSWNKMED